MIRSLALNAAALILLSSCAPHHAPQAATTQPSPPPPPPVAPAAPVAPVAPAAQPAPAAEATPVAAPKGPKEIFPHVYFDAVEKSVTFDGEVPIDAHNTKIPVVYLEVFACPRDTKEHESLVVSYAQPSHIHAALLLAGLQPGKPGEFDWTGPEMKAIAPEGARVDVRFEYELKGEHKSVDPATWIVSARTRKSLRETKPAAHFIFTGSREATNKGVTVYDADKSGTLIGLSTFSTETIAWSDMYNHDSGVEEPQWIADSAHVPVLGTKLRVVITGVKK